MFSWSDRDRRAASSHTLNPGHEGYARPGCLSILYLTAGFQDWPVPSGKVCLPIVVVEAGCLCGHLWYYLCL